MDRVTVRDDGTRSSVQPVDTSDCASGVYPEIRHSLTRRRVACLAAHPIYPSATIDSPHRSTFDRSVVYALPDIVLVFNLSAIGAARLAWAELKPGAGRTWVSHFSAVTQTFAESASTDPSPSPFCAVDAALCELRRFVDSGCLAQQVSSASLELARAAIQDLSRREDADLDVWANALVAEAALAKD